MHFRIVPLVQVFFNCVPIFNLISVYSVKEEIGINQPYNFILLKCEKNDRNNYRDIIWWILSYKNIHLRKELNGGKNTVTIKNLWAKMFTHSIF